MDDASLLAAFESCSLPRAELRHREHLRLAWLYLTTEASFEAAALRLCTGLRRYTRSLGKADRYHETITWAYLALVNERRHASRAASFDAFADANADLFAPDLAALAPFYDRETLRSDLARRIFVLPGSSSRPRGALEVSSPRDDDDAQPTPIRP